jgi:hypothetical protein
MVNRQAVIFKHSTAGNKVYDPPISLPLTLSISSLSLSSSNFVARSGMSNHLVNIGEVGNHVAVLARKVHSH